MSQSSLQYQLSQKGGSYSLVSTPRPGPRPTEICIRTKAIALNPADWKRQDFGIMVESWPAVLGLEVAGVVDAVGESVKGFKPGDEVLSLAGMDNPAGAFQEVVTVPSHFAAKKPETLTFEEAASIPLGYLTAACAIINGLHIALPHLDVAGTGSPKSVLVLGGSSAVGAAAIQLLRLALPSATILTTSSAQHHANLISLGADKCFERSVQDDPSAIKAATRDGSGVDAILDTVGAAVSQPAVFTALSAEGPKLFSQVATGQNPQIPEGVNSTVIVARQLFGVKGGLSAFSSLVGLVENGQYKLPVKVEVVGKGYEKIKQGLETLKKGVSGAKLVVSV